MALGQVGAAGGVGVGVGVGVDVGATLTTAGVVVNVRPAVTALALATVADAVCGTEATGELEAVVASGLAAIAAGTALPPSIAESALSALDVVDVLATISALVRVAAGDTDGPAPWIRITAATTAVARTTAFFNVCTPIQRLHCPPN
jgi:hypothetical protein